MRKRMLIGLLASVALVASATGVAAVDLPISANPSPVVDDEIGSGMPRGGLHVDPESAVDAASRGTVVRVCPGRYPESVTVGKPLRLIGVPAVVDAVDCFATSLPAYRRATTRSSGLRDDSLVRTSTAFTLEADSVELSGFVVMGVRLGVHTDHAGLGCYEIHHSLFVDNSLGVPPGQRRGAGPATSVPGQPQLPPRE